MKKVLIFIFGLFLCINLIAQKTDSKNYKQILEEQKQIKNQTQNSGYIHDLKTGLYFKVINQDKKALQPVDGDFVDFIFTLRTKDSTIIPSYHSGDQIIESLFKGDFYDALRFMHEKDSISFILNGDSIYKYYMGNQVYPFGKNPLYMDIKLLKITPKEEFEKLKFEEKKQYELFLEDAKVKEDSLLTEYIKKNNINVKPTESGLYLIKESSINGNQISIGSVVEVHYILSLIDGTLIQSSYEMGQPIKLTVGKNEVIPAWEEALQLMKVGEKAKLIIPSKLAYGAQGAGQIIPPYSTLIFEIEVISGN